MPTPNAPALSPPTWHARRSRWAGPLLPPVLLWVQHSQPFEDGYSSTRCKQNINVIAVIWGKYASAQIKLRWYEFTPNQT